MRKLLSVMLVLVMLLTQLVISSFAYDVGDEWVDPYEGLAIKSVSAEAQRGLIENIDGGYMGVEYEDGTVEEYLYYDPYYAEPVFTVEYENGEIESGKMYDLYGYMWFEDTQETEHWDLGKHSVTGYYRDFEFTFEVEVVENPVASITAVAQRSLVEGWDSYEDSYFDEENNEVSYTGYNVYGAEPVFTITMKDGTVFKGTDEEIYDQTGYRTFEAYNQYENPLKVGKNIVVFEYMGIECECEIEVTPNPYKGVSIKGENEVYLVFEGVDEKDTYETKVISAYLYDWNMEGDYYAEIITDNGEIYDIVIYSDIGEDGLGTLDKNVSIAIGPFTTNTLENCNYFKVAYNSESILTGVMEYYQLSETISGKQFNSYSADEGADINDIVALSAFIGADYDDYDYTDDSTVYKFSANEIEDIIEKVFGITDVDVKDSDFYRPLFRRIEITAPWITNCYYADSELVFENGKWIDTADVYNVDTDEMVGKITVVRNPDGTIYSIDFAEIEIQQGDVNCDGKVTAVDARVVLQYVAGLISEDEFYSIYADMNGDGDITAVDARMILQVVAGLTE